jgi:hypothetical protein
VEKTANVVTFERIANLRIILELLFWKSETWLVHLSSKINKIQGIKVIL